jgi:DNA primase
MSLPAGFLDELKARTSLASLVGRRVKLVRGGRDLKGCCPFHHEKTPSFHVYADHYHCFGCGAHGDAIGWMMEAEGHDFMAAVRTLAEEAGMAVPEARRDDGRADDRARLQTLVAAAARWFEARLAGPEGTDARAYLARRVISPELAASFGLGYAPESREALAKALANEFPGLDPAQLVAAGLQGEAEGGRRYDRFRGRLMFPIHDARGRTVGFGGRILGAGEPKYLNSAEGPLFAKGRLLYNLHRAAPAARKAGRLLVVEGYMDVIGLARVGIAEAVAPLGTALTEDQIRLLWTIAPEPVLAFDGDAAGYRAALRASELALPGIRAERNLRVAVLTGGQDPDDVARVQGKRGIEDIILSSIPLEEFLFKEVSKQFSFDKAEGFDAFSNKLTELSGKIDDPQTRATYRTAFNLKFRDFRRSKGKELRAHQVKRAVESVLPETRLSKSTGAFTCARLLQSFALRLSAVPRFEEQLAQLEIADRRLAQVREALLAGRPFEPGLLAGVSPLVPAEAPDHLFDRQIGLDLAARLAASHVAGGPASEGDDVEARTHYARVLRESRAELIDRLRAEAIGAELRRRD